MCATSDWSFLARLGATSAYVPSTADVAYGDRIREQWLSFARGEAPRDMLPFATSDTSPYNVAVLGDVQLSGRTVNTWNARSDLCDVLLHNGLNPDQRFWLVN
jgi:hypothetical protein